MAPDKIEMVDISAPPGSQVPRSKEIVSYQYRALLRRHAILQTRQRGRTICQIVVPFVLLLISFIFQLIATALIPSVTPVTVTPGSIPLSLPSASQYYEYSWMTPPAAGSGSPGYLFENGTSSGMLSFINQRNYNRPNGTVSRVPFFQDAGSETTAMAGLLAIFRVLANVPLAQSQSNSNGYFYQLPTTYITIQSVNATGGQIQYTARANSNADYTRALPFTTFGSLNVTLPRAMVINQINNALSRAWGGVRLIASITGLPFVVQVPSLNIGDLLSLLLYPFALSFLLPVLMYTLVLERENKVMGFMIAVGLRVRNYYLAHFLFSYLLYACVALVFLAFGFAFQIRFFTQTAPLILFLVLFLWGLLIVMLAIVFSTVFDRTRTATLVAYLVVIIGVMVALYLNFQVFGTNVPSVGFIIYPPFAFYRALYIMSNACSLNACLTTSDLGRSGEMLRLVIAMFLEFLVLILIAVYATKARLSGCCWCFTACFRACKRAVQGERRSSLPISREMTAFSAESPDLARSPATVEDPDVAAEKQRVLSGMFPSDCPVVAKQIRKTFGDKHALDSVSFALRKGECFGLLGPNGAGKTTLISILTGLLDLSSGHGYIGGHDVSYEIGTVRHLIGICPQHDILWDELSCLEHLLFYCRLKGVPADREIETAQNLLKSVGLQDVPDRLAGQLSGGMKRRLSVAMSLCGDPGIIFMDEPTTGTDPYTRRQLWGVIGAATRGRCVLLTTHRMDEADVLCSRIGIMAKGTLRAIGPQQVLKGRYGGAFLLRVNYAPMLKEEAEQLVSELVPQAVVSSEAPGTIAYEVPGTVTVSSLFSSMDSRAKDNGITAWSITQRSLEDVFLSIIKEASGPTR
eukprot:TRINITY_DN2465_c0_g1_i1.p1 TRINITY_DN2465_c0_g1~~TRINITY_DN2465_c0_g1_i1.p1  ORF type:complete len:861 (-),score=171.86 TRINITY_DN2465_c0_g1_i1:103-2685(-)